MIRTPAKIKWFSERNLVRLGSRRFTSSPSCHSTGTGKMADYEIRVKGHLDQGWGEWFGGLEIRNLEGGEAVLSGELSDQAALHGVLNKVRDLGLPLVAITSGGPG